MHCSAVDCEAHGFNITRDQYEETAAHGMASNDYYLKLCQKINDNNVTTSTILLLPLIVVSCSNGKDKEHDN